MKEIAVKVIEQAKKSEVMMSNLEKFKYDIKIKYTDIEKYLSVDEIEIYETSNLELKEVNDRDILAKSDINPSQLDAFGKTNLERMEQGKPPLDGQGRPIELHHIGQGKNSPLAELTVQEHRGPENYSILHDRSKPTEINRLEFKIEREEHWKARAEDFKLESEMN